MRVLGIDLAAKPRKTAACVLDDDLGLKIVERCDDKRLRVLAKDCEKVGIDCPFGWPDAFVDALVAHRSGRPWPAPDEEPDAFRASLSFRETDRHVMGVKRPLSVSTDRIGVTAMRCAHLLDRWGVVDRSGAGKFVEVYPAAALKRWDLDPDGYKGASGLVRLGALLEALPLDLPDEAQDQAARSDDAFDAVICALIARAAAHGLTEGPPQHLREQAAREGWIHLPQAGSLSAVAGRARRRGGG